MKNLYPGFTLIEMMVSVAIFSIVMMVGVGALLALVEFNRRAEAVNSVMQNLNAAIEGMSRAVRVGGTYHCEVSPTIPPDITSVEDCATEGGLLLAFEASGGSPSNANDQVVYRLNGTQIERSTNSGVNWVAITAPEVKIESLKFFVTGSARPPVDRLQARVLVRIQGSAEIPGGTTVFSIQTSMTKRVPDI